MPWHTEDRRGAPRAPSRALHLPGTRNLFRSGPKGAAGRRTKEKRLVGVQTGGGSRGAKNLTKVRREYSADRQSTGCADSLKCSLYRLEPVRPAVRARTLRPRKVHCCTSSTIRWSSLLHRTSCRAMPLAARPFCAADFWICVLLG